MADQDPAPEQKRPVTVRGMTLPETVEAPIEPLDISGVRTVTTGTTLFLVATVALLLNLEWLRDQDRMWWLWTCLVGIGLGGFGYVYCTRRARHLLHAEQRPNRHRTHTLD